MGGKFEVDGTFGSLSISVRDDGQTSIAIDGGRPFEVGVKELATLLEQHAKFMDYIDKVE